MLYLPTASRDEMIQAIYDDLDAIDFFIKLDPEAMETEDLREKLQAWTEAGDETA